ncbi:MAG: glycosyltransferase family 2 protein [Gammaproteobacteria bacterium]|nr:glycosyltransferase family 2 protein [Gammaproteobacteria bacterium]MBU1732202.1 glycosyltransferase family 2 protein [Gammaproteobacteria bacterium]MBU1893268.1 glycosyltransferase family 2 protein [Gammaproteobacteria bacterium]
MQSDKPVVDVLLAIYNGEFFLAQQIESILAQSYRQIRLIVRDDGSSDSSVAIVRSFAERYPEQVVLLEDTKGNLGSTGNFLQLLGFSVADYVMLSDQDDVWLPEKVAITLSAMKKCEVLHGKSMPILVHTDLTVANKDLSVVSQSFWKYQNIDPKLSGINRLLVQNVVTGCTVMMNRSLMNLVRPVTDGIVEHDWWLALLAAAFGRIVHVDSPTLFYRQHGKNVLGAVRWDAWAACRKFLRRDTRKPFSGNLKKTRLQAARFLQMYGPQLPTEVALKISSYVSLEHLSFFARLVCIVRYRFYKNGIKRNAGMFLSLMDTPTSGHASIRDVN